MSTVCLAIFGIGPTEMLVVGAIALLLFGNRLPEAMRGIGRGLKEFRDGASGIEPPPAVEQNSELQQHPEQNHQEQNHRHIEEVAP